jgi:ABC-2 type transport system ATP-binding protein
MEEAQDLCDRLAIVDHGKLLAMGTLDELRRLIGEKDIVRLSGQFNPQAVRSALAGVDGAEIVSVEEKALILAVEGATRKLPAIFAAVLAAGGEIQEMSLSQASLEALFIKLTGRALRE